MDPNPPNSAADAILGILGRFVLIGAFAFWLLLMFASLESLFGTTLAAIGVAAILAFALWQFMQYRKWQVTIGDWIVWTACIGVALAAWRLAS